VTHDAAAHLRDTERRLAEARAMVEALLAGQIDAVVDPNTHTPVLLAKAQEALRASEERTTYALRAAGIGIWELDITSGNATWSETMPALFGRSPEATPTTAKGFLALIHPEDREVTETNFRAALAAGNDFEAEFRTVWPDGVVHWIASEAHFRQGHEGQSASMLGVNTDISDRKLLELQFRQAQKMEAIGHLAGGIAHDFNNLLTVILGYSNFVIDSMTPLDERRSDMAEVVKAGERAAALTRQLLAFSRKQVLQPAAVDLNTLVNGMKQMLGRLIGEQIDFVQILAPDLGVVRADPGQLEQVLMNLVVNARDAMPAGGRLSVETTNVEVDGSFMPGALTMPGPYVMLAVSDNGTGMGEATKRRLFEPFFTTKGIGKGTGLGLATVYGIVKQSGGHVWVQSELGQGATFKVLLPRTDETTDVTTRDRDDRLRAAATETVLVVEDEDAVRLLTRRILEERGYRVFDAPNAMQAEVIFTQTPEIFSLLVTDVIMPGISGPKLFERLSRRRPELRVLYVSGYTDDMIVHQGQLRRGVEFLQKPFTAEALNRTVREILAR
jgi:two-component system cell cycle sensor histidine kinase/response regulator CckA